MTAEPTPIRRPKPDRRIQLARSILAHRRWCPACQPHADDVTEALDGTPVDEITGGG